MPRRHSRGSTRRGVRGIAKIDWSFLPPREVTRMPPVEKSGRPAGAASRHGPRPRAGGWWRNRSCRARRVGSFGNRLLPGKATGDPRGRGRQVGAQAAVTGRPSPPLVKLARGTHAAGDHAPVGRFEGAMISSPSPGAGTGSEVAPVPTAESVIRPGRRADASRSRRGWRRLDWSAWCRAQSVWWWAPAARRAWDSKDDGPGPGSGPGSPPDVAGRFQRRPASKADGRARAGLSASCFRFDSRLGWLPGWFTDRSWTSTINLLVRRVALVQGSSKTAINAARLLA